MDLVAGKPGKDKLRFALWCVIHSLEWCRESSETGLPRHTVVKRLEARKQKVYNTRFRYQNVHQGYRNSGDERADKIGYAQKVKVKGRTKREIGRDLEECCRGVSRFSVSHALLLWSVGPLLFSRNTTSARFTIRFSLVRAVTGP